MNLHRLPLRRRRPSGHALVTVNPGLYATVYNIISPIFIEGSRRWKLIYDDES